MTITMERPVETAATVYTCATCGKAANGKRNRGGGFGIPMRWKSRDGQSFCGDCWKGAYRLRAVTLPVAGAEGMEWAELRKLLRDCWTQSTTLANACVLELMRAEPLVAVGEKLPKAPKLYLYPLIDKLGLTITKTSGSALIQAVQSKYNSARFDLLVKRNIAPPVYQYPYPYPVHNSAWKASIDNGIATVSVPLNGQRVTLVLKGKDRHYQLKAVEQIVSGSAKQGELSLYERGKNVFCKMVAWLPVEQHRFKRDLVMTLRTDEERFLVATLEGRETPWVLNEDNLRQHIIGHAVSLHRMAEDYKSARRFGGDRRAYGQNVRAKCDRQNRRLADAVHRISKMVVEYAKQNGVKAIMFDHADRKFVRFPWTRLSTALEYKCTERGIALCDVTKPQAEEEANG